MRSSYIENNLGEILLTYVRCFRPMILVELGVLDGYSTSFIVQGMKINKERWNLSSHLDAYDLWEKYSYTHGDFLKTENLFKEDNINDFVTLYKGDAFEVWKNYPDRSIHFLHVDLSNTGEILRRIMGLWDKKIYQGGIVAFEGGSEERDNIEWMKKYNKEPIKPEIESNPIIKKNYIYATYQKFPSITVLYKKWDNS